MAGTLGQRFGTGVLFAKSSLAFIFTSEQFWGRAARAPRSRKRFEAPVIFGGNCLNFSAQVNILAVRDGLFRASA
jgi:hypothetical protein